MVHFEHPICAMAIHHLLHSFHCIQDEQTEHNWTREEKMCISAKEDSHILLSDPTLASLSLHYRLDIFASRHCFNPINLAYDCLILWQIWRERGKRGIKLVI